MIDFTAATTRFAALFSGYEKAHGAFRPKNTNDAGKLEGRAWTQKSPVTLDLYEQHLLGNVGLGIVLLRTDNTVLFGAIDCDDYSIDHKALEQRSRKLALPLVLCRSKSGGAHLFCFAESPVPAAQMTERLTEWAALLGIANLRGPDGTQREIERFPKQSTRFNDDDISSWINLPYFNYEATTRYCLLEGRAVGLEEFLAYAETHKATEGMLSNPAGAAAGDLFEDGPPCLALLHSQGGFDEGTRNNGMAAVVVYLKKRYPHDWQEHVDTYNTAMAKLKSAELQQLVKGHARKEYQYQCKQPPISAVCQRKACLKRQYGVGGDPEAEGVEIGGLTRYDSPHGDEPMWGLEVNGKRVMISNTQFYERDQFNRACMSQVNELPVHVSHMKWLKYLGELIRSADIITMPEDAGPTGQFFEWLNAFCFDQVNAVTRDGILNGMVYYEDGHVYFRSHDLFRYLDSRRVQYRSQQWVWQTLHNKGAEKVFWNIKKKGVNLWRLPAVKPDDSEDESQLEKEPF